MNSPIFCIFTIVSILYSGILRGAELLDSAPGLEGQSFVSMPMTEEGLRMPVPVVRPSYKDPLLAAGLSGLFPGLGHFYLEDPRTAGALMGTAGTSLAFGYGFNRGEAVRASGLTIYQTTSFYGVYAAYRDARLLNGERGYRYKMPTESLADLSYAPFQLSVLKKPEVWGGLLGALVVATGVACLSASSSAQMKCDAVSDATRPLLAFPIGIGEEAFFRGFVQPCFAETCTPWGGIAISSLAFGAAHLGNARHMSSEERKRYYTYSIPFITTAGVYFGWVAHKNHSLKESVALHSWYDFILFGLGAVASQASTGTSRVDVSIPF